MLEISPELLDQLQLLFTQYALRALGATAILVIGILLAGRIRHWIARAADRLRLDRTLVGFVNTLAYWGVITIVVVTALNHLGVGTVSLAAVVAAVSLAVGFALQGSLANFAAGVIILLIRPYRVGDYIQVGGVEGWVTNVQIFNTHLETRDHKTIIIPNGNVTSDNIVNFSTKGYVRVDMVFGISYSDDIRKAKQLLLEIVTAHPKVLQEPAPQIGVLELADSSVNIATRPFVMTEDYWRVQLDITEQVKLRFDAAGLSIPFPQRDVHLFQPSSD